MSKVAIIIATYQRNQLLRKCIDSCGGHSPVFVVYSEQKDILGLDMENVTAISTALRGAGVKGIGGDAAVSAGCEYLVFLDDDCFPAPFSIKRMLSTIMSNESFGVVGAGSRWNDNGLVFSGNGIAEVQHTGDFWITRAADYVAAGGIDCSMRIAEDYDYQVRLRISGKKIVVVKDAMFEYIPEAEGGLSELGIWRGANRALRGKMEAIKKLSYKFPGMFVFSDSFVEINSGFENLCALYAENKVKLDRQEGVVWT